MIFFNDDDRKIIMDIFKKRIDIERATYDIPATVNAMLRRAVFIKKNHLKEKIVGKKDGEQYIKEYSLCKFVPVTFQPTDCANDQT